MNSTQRCMVAVISDLHFEEEASDRIEVADGCLPIDVLRNIPAAAFEDMVRDVVNLAKSKQITELHVVLAGDIFDLHRTQLWFKGESIDQAHGLRPYVDNDAVKQGSPLETLLLRILDAIADEERVKQSLAVFQRFAGGSYIDDQGRELRLDELSIKQTLHFIPGNHDRLVNTTAAIRLRVRQLLNLLPTPDPFPHQIEFDNPALLVRHGHEYDRYNFAYDYSHGEIPEVVPGQLYAHATFGDFVTVNIASRLPYLFRRHYGSGRILRDPIKRAAYVRLLQFDDVRPQTALLDFLLSTAVPEALAKAHSQDQWQTLLWNNLEPVVMELADEIVRDRAFARLARQVLPAWVLILLSLRPWRFGIPAGPVRWTVAQLRPAPDAAQLSAAREAALRRGRRFILAGHTHKPQLALLSKNGDPHKSYFVDTGTWRNAILTATDDLSFGRVNAMTYVAISGDSNISPMPAERRSFAYRTGFSQHWPVDEYDR